MASLLSSFEFFASGAGIIITCAISAAMVLLWDWRFSLIGLVIVQFGVAAVALQTGLIEARLMIVQVCIVALCALILALSSAQTTKSPTIYQPGNWMMRLLTLILVYTALRLFDFNFSLPFPVEIEAGDALRMTVFFVWISICALLTLGLSDNPLFTGIALLLWSVPAHVFATLLTPESGVSVLIGIMELLLALGCSYLILTESFSIKQRPVVATDITFPVEGRRLLTDNGIVPIGEMTTLDIPAVPMTAEARQAMMGKTLPQTAPQGTVLRDTQPTGEFPRVNQAQINRDRTNRSTQPTGEFPRVDQAQANRTQANRNRQPTGEFPRVNPTTQADQAQTAKARANQSQADQTKANRKTQLTGEFPKVPQPQGNQQQTNPPQANQPRDNQHNQQRVEKREGHPPPPKQRRVRSTTPLTRTNLRAVQKPLTDPSQPSRPPQPLPNQLAEELQEPTRPTPNLFGTTTQPQSSPSADSEMPINNASPADKTASDKADADKADGEKTDAAKTAAKPSIEPPVQQEKSDKDPLDTGK